jgi:5-methyltetrahydrofolate--homocysteine methyltransferase
VDPVVFLIAVNGEFGVHVLYSVRELCQKFGSEIHIPGGCSNVSLGLPSRAVINNAFFALALDAGVDSGIIDPLTIRIEDLAEMDRSSRTYRLAEDVRPGRDVDCATYVGV